MNEDKHTDETTQRPAWWKDEHDTSWGKVKASVVEEWQKMGDGAKELEKKVADKALAFGHAARSTFHKFEGWTDELERRLAADWKKTEKDAGEGWDKVRNAVKHGWERAKASVKSTTKS